MNLAVTVGPGGSPDENGETTIDALLMNGVFNIVSSLSFVLFLSLFVCSC